MATRTLEVLVDDLDGTAAAQTVPFGIDGVSYEIDLSQANADRLRELLTEFVAAARRTGGRRKQPQTHTEPDEIIAELVPKNGAHRTPKSGDKNSKKSGKKNTRNSGAKTSPKSRANGRGKASSDKKARDAERVKTIREWANVNGYEISSRGRIPVEVEEAYMRADQEVASAST